MTQTTTAIMSLFSRLFAPKKLRPLISQARLSSLLSSQIRMASNCKIRFADSAYLCAEKEETFRFARNSATFYDAEVGDCDDAAILCKAEAIKWARKQGFNYPIAVGLAWMPSHAVNICVNEHGEVWVIDYARIIKPSELPEDVNLVIL